MTTKDFAITKMKQMGVADATAFRNRITTTTVSNTEIIANEGIIPNWRQGAYNTIGAAVKYNNQVYTVTQTHDSTSNPDWKPGVAYSLFDLKHTTDATAAKPYVAPQGSWGLYDIGECMIWTDNKVYKSIIDNNAYTPATYAAGWEVATLT